MLSRRQFIRNLVFGAASVTLAAKTRVFGLSALPRMDVEEQIHADVVHLVEEKIKEGRYFQYYTFDNWNTFKL